MTDHPVVSVHSRPTTQADQVDIAQLAVASVDAILDRVKVLRAEAVV